MRIISGKYGGRRIHPPAHMPHTRPTTDIAKEGLFNILQNRVAIDGATTLDLFGGTGCISYELASRGAEQLTIVEKDKTMLDFIKKNIDFLKIENTITIQMDVFQFLATCNQQYDIIFAGPPYALNTIDDLPRIIVEKKLISPEGYFILEHTPRNDYKTFEGYSFQRNYGATIFSFFECI
jgi:16S rRNA (guanine(966)-N(2))-methyltransferase RsmD